MLTFHQRGDKNQREELIALFKGTLYRTGKEWTI